MSETLSIPAGYGAGPPTVARVEVADPDGPVVIVTEIASNPGLSVTNNAEAIVASVRERYGPEAIVVEHYDDGSYEGGRNREETFDLVAVENGAASWFHLGETQEAAMATLRRVRQGAT